MAPDKIITISDYYYKKTEIDTMMNGKANTSHTHTTSEITDFPVIPDAIIDTGWQNVSFSDGYTNHSNDNLKIRRIGNIVEINGSWTVLKDKTASSAPVKFATIDEMFRPESEIYIRQQGPGMNTYLLSVEPNGNVYWSKYGTSSSSNLTASNQYICHALWTVNGGAVGGGGSNGTGGSNVDLSNYYTKGELDELIPYNYQITASKYNVDINTDVTITVKITNQLGQPVVGVTVPVLKDNETWQSGTTGVNGTFSLTYTADTWGLVMFSTNSANIQINVKGWKTVQTTDRFTVKSNGRMVSIRCNQLSNSGEVGTEYTLGTLNTGYRPTNPITIPTQSIGDDGSHFGFIRVDTAGVIKLIISRTTYTSSGGRTLYGTVEFGI